MNESSRASVEAKWVSDLAFLLTGKAPRCRSQQNRVDDSVLAVADTQFVNSSL